MYWPKLRSTIEYGQISVYCKQEICLLNYTIRKFVLTKETTEMIVTQFHFTSWPDFGVPECTGPLLKFINKVEAHQKTSECSGPMIIHCRYIRSEILY